MGTVKVPSPARTPKKRVMPWKFGWKISKEMLEARAPRHKARRCWPSTPSPPRNGTKRDAWCTRVPWYQIFWTVWVVDFELEIWKPKRNCGWKNTSQSCQKNKCLGWRLLMRGCPSTFDILWPCKCSQVPTMGIRGLGHGQDFRFPYFGAWPQLNKLGSNVAAVVHKYQLRNISHCWSLITIIVNDCFNHYCKLFTTMVSYFINHYILMLLNNSSIITWTYDMF